MTDTAGRTPGERHTHTFYCHIHTRLYCQKLLCWVPYFHYRNHKLAITALKPESKEQPVTSGETRTGTVWDQRAIICPKCKIQDVTLTYISLKWLLGTADLTQSQKIVQTRQERSSRPFGDIVCFIQHFERVYRETFTVLRTVSSIVLHCLVAL